MHTHTDCTPTETALVVETQKHITAMAKQAADLTGKFLNNWLAEFEFEPGQQRSLPRQFLLEIGAILTVADWEQRGHSDALPAELRDPDDLWNQMWAAIEDDAVAYVTGDRGENLTQQVMIVWIERFLPTPATFDGVYFQRANVRFTDDAIEALIDLLLTAEAEQRERNS